MFCEKVGITECIMGLRIKKYNIHILNYKNLTDEPN
jgi:hypothetical protein